MIKRSMYRPNCGRKFEKAIMYRKMRTCQQAERLQNKRCNQTHDIKDALQKKAQHNSN